MNKKKQAVCVCRPFCYPDKYNGENERRKHIDRMLNGMDDKELSFIEIVAEGIEKSRTAGAK